MTFHCLIVGSRGYTDYVSFKAKCDALLADRTDIEIVSGGVSGTDALAEPLRASPYRKSSIIRSG